MSTEVQHPGVILEMEMMLGFPTETEEEAMMTLDFISVDTCDMAFLFF